MRNKRFFHAKKKMKEDDDDVFPLIMIM